MEFHLTILTPQRKYFDGNVESITLSTRDGEITILANHARMIANVEICKLRIAGKGNRETFALGGGAINVINSTTVVLMVSSIESKNEIDIARAIKDKEAAEKLIISSKNQKDIKNSENLLRKALNRINIADSDY